MINNKNVEDCTSVTVGTQTTSLTYEEANRVTGITYPSTATNSFVYDGLRLRVFKTDSSGTFAYVCDGTDPASPVLKDGAATYTPGLSERRGSTSKFQHADALGSTRGITDSSQAVTDSVLYDAFGVTVATTGSSANPYMFAATSGYRNDGDAGLMHVGARYYDAQVGRFITRDTYLDQKPYLYCKHDPVNALDPTGHAGTHGNGIGFHPKDELFPGQWWFQNRVSQRKEDIFVGITGGAITGFAIGGGPTGVLPGAVGGALTGMFDKELHKLYKMVFK